ncbi:putative reverse transcriptase domain-containing protein [Tanacetum coccineum]
MLDAFTSSMCVESWGRISFARALIKISSHSTLKKEVTMAIPEDEGDGHIKEVIRVEYEWKPPHCVECKSFGHGHNLCPKHVREEVPKAQSMAAKSSTMEENEEGFVEVKSRKKNKGDASRSFGGLRLPKPNSKVIWQQKRSVGSKGGSNTASPSGNTKENNKGDGGKSSPSRTKPNLNTLVSNPFDVLNVVGEDICDPRVQIPKAKENSKSKFSELEDESDEDEVYMPHGGGFMDGMEDDLNCYEAQVYDFFFG